MIVPGFARIRPPAPEVPVPVPVLPGFGPGILLALKFPFCD